MYLRPGPPPNHIIMPQQVPIQRISNPVQHNMQPQPQRQVGMSMNGQAVRIEPVQRNIPVYTFKTFNPNNQRVQTPLQRQTVNRPESMYTQIAVLNEPQDLVPSFNQNTINNQYQTQNSPQVNVYALNKDLSLQITEEKKDNKPQSYQNMFSKYAAGDRQVEKKYTIQELLGSKPKSSSSNLMNNYYESMVEPVKETFKLTQTPSYSFDSSQLQKEKEKVAELTKQLTKLSLQNGDLLLEVAQTNRNNNTLKKQNDKLKQQLQELKNRPKTPEPAGLFIDSELLAQIQAIKEREGQIFKIKKEYLQIIESKYQEEMKRIAGINNVLKVELHNMKFDLGLAKEATREKQVKIDFMQKQIEALESKTINQTKSVRQRVQMQLNEKNIEMQAMKQSLCAMELQYKAQRKQIADKDDFIAKYMAGRTGEDSEAIQLLIDKYNFYSKKQFQTSTVESK